jgi:alkylation response protein AidB-like acyl-CoA dehydrogenase
MTDTAELCIEEYRALLDEVFDDQVVGWTAEAEASERFPQTDRASRRARRVRPQVAQRSAPRRAQARCAGRWWRDMKLARIGGGTDEVLWELVAAAMKPDYDGYNELMGDPPG